MAYLCPRLGLSYFPLPDMSTYVYNYFCAFIRFVFNIGLVVS